MIDLPASGVVLPELESVEATLSFAEAAESAGAPSLWCSGSWGYGPTPLLGALAERTDCVLGTGITNVYAHSPTALAMDAMVLQQATGGRFVLGVGTGTPAIANRFHGRRFERPIRRVRETIEIVRLALSGKPIDYAGEIFDLDGFELYGVPTGGVDVPIIAAAIGDTNLAMALDFADGITTYLMPIEAVPAALSRALERARADETVPVIAQIPTCVSEDSAAGRAILAAHLAYYVGAIEVYHGVVARNGFATVANRIRESWTAGERDRARAAVTDELLDAVGVFGTPERARRQLEHHLAGPVDGVLLTFPEGTDAAMRRLAVETLATM